MEADGHQTPLRRYRRPDLRSLPSIYEDYTSTPRTPITPRRGRGRGRGGADVSRCTPALDKMEAFGPGSKMMQDRLIINFIRSMSQGDVQSQVHAV